MAVSPQPPRSISSAARGFLQQRLTSLAIPCVDRQILGDPLLLASPAGAAELVVGARCRLVRHSIPARAESLDCQNATICFSWLSPPCSRRATRRNAGQTSYAPLRDRAGLWREIFSGARSAATGHSRRNCWLRFRKAGQRCSSPPEYDRTAMLVIRLGAGAVSQAFRP